MEDPRPRARDDNPFLLSNVRADLSPVRAAGATGGIGGGVCREAPLPRGEDEPPAVERTPAHRLRVFGGEKTCPVLPRLCVPDHMPRPPAAHTPRHHPYPHR
ncbi:hypothetical protein GCM10017673_18610 [Streptosporangium violaceochromogenes]|nr:hypothetical protein GCM10017673_18610 [Streptosporangium violaceochromogenes]